MEFFHAFNTYWIDHLGDCTHLNQHRKWVERKSLPAARSSGNLYSRDLILKLLRINSSIPSKIPRDIIFCFTKLPISEFLMSSAMLQQLQDCLPSYRNIQQLQDCLLSCINTNVPAFLQKHITGISNLVLTNSSSKKTRRCFGKTNLRKQSTAFRKQFLFSNIMSVMCFSHSDIFCFQ